MKTIVTFSNLFPSSVMPVHGLFVCERMRRVAAATGYGWCVIAPVPEVAWPLRHGVYRRWHRVPALEHWQGVEVHHPRYRHLPGLSLRRQADAVAAGARATLRDLAARGEVVVDAHYVWPDGVAAAALAQELALPFTITARGTDATIIARDRVVARRIAAAAPCAAGLFAVNRALGDCFAAAAGLAPDRVVVVRNGVDLERFAPGDAAAARRALGLPATGRLLLGVGRLVPAKSFGVAARALRGLPDDVRLVLVGEGAQRRAIARAGGGRVVFLGPRSPQEVALACRAADLLVLPSTREGWPNIVTEALASGLPIVATAVGGLPEIFGQSGPGSSPLGELVAPGDEAAFGRAVAAALLAPRDRAAVRRFGERYGWDEPVAFLSSVFRRAFGEGGT